MLKLDLFKKSNQKVILNTNDFIQIVIKSALESYLGNNIFILSKIK